MACRALWAAVGVWALPSAGMGWKQGTDPQLHTPRGNLRSTTDVMQQDLPPTVLRDPRI